MDNSETLQSMLAGQIQKNGSAQCRSALARLTFPLGKTEVELFLATVGAAVRETVDEHGFRMLVFDKLTP